MKYIATFLSLSFAFPAALFSVELSESLRKVGTKATVDKDGSISVHFSVPRPPSGPFGQPVFDPNFKPPPPVTAVHLAEVAKLPKLHALTLRGTPLKASITDVLGVLAEAKDLRQLDLTMVRGVTDESLGLIVGLPALEDLSLDNCRSVTNRGLSHVAKLKNLRRVNLVSTQVDDAGLAVLANAKNLETLNLKFTRVKGDGFTSLKALPKLVSLTLNPNRNTADKTDLDLTPLSNGFAALRQLEVGGNRIANEHLAPLANLKNLEKLAFRTIGYTQITDTGLASLAGLAKLREINLNGSVKVTDVGIGHFAKLMHLQKIDLGRTAVTAESAKILGKLPALTEVQIVHSRVGPQFAQVIRQLNPKVKVVLHRPVY
jgi:internalin A